MFDRGTAGSVLHGVSVVVSLARILVRYVILLLILYRIRQIGFGDEVSTKVLIDRTCAEISGTMLTSLLALKHGLAVNCAGGTHHAFRSHGKGYCIMNDLAITSKYLIDSGACSKVLILDLDVHQGDGTAKILENRPDIFTCSFHASRNFPAKKERSDLDIPLDDGCGDDEYLGILSETLPPLLKKFKPCIVLYDAGVDVHEHDALGRLKITDDGLLRRENLVIDTVFGGFEIPLAGYVGGGYDDNVTLLAKRHLNLFSAALDAWSHHCVSI